MNEALQSVDRAYNENKDAIEKAMFDLALEGIANGRMDYQKDPILPHVLTTINRTVEKFSAISAEEQENMVALTDAQKEAIRTADARARDEYLQSEPKVEGSLRANPVVAKILEAWGK